MRRLWSEFRAIAISGSVLDLALGFIIGAAFATLIQSFASNVFMQLVAAIFGKQDFSKLQITVNHSQIRYGAFLTDLLNFLLLAVAIFLIVKLMMMVGVERGRSFDMRQCPYCLDRVPREALTCRACGQTIVERLPSLAEAERELAARQARRWPALPVRGRPGAGPDAGSGAVSSDDAGAGAGAAGRSLDGGR